tara:strand:+ start:101 stop:700 length:600 start_codon:yes stop_codon:yes gene_type:complete
MRIFLSILILIFSLQSWSKADDISEFEIEGISVGDSLLLYMDEKEIKNEFKKNREHYAYLKEPFKFREVYKFNNPNFEQYESISFFVKPDDKSYIIYFIRGMKSYINDMEACLEQRNIISNEIENLIPESKTYESNFKSSLDKSGRSSFKQLIFIFNSGDEIVISCNDWEESLRKKNNWTEGLSVAIHKKEITDWFENR